MRSPRCVDRLLLSDRQDSTIRMPRKSPFLFLFLISLSLSDSPLSPLFALPSLFPFLFFFFLSLSTYTSFSCLSHPHIFSFLSIFSSLPFSLISHLIASPTRMDQVGETSPHFPSWPLVITMFFFLIFFIFFFPFITSCNTWLNMSHLFQVHHMDLALCHSLWEPHGIHMCHPTPDASKNVKFRLSRNPMKFDGITRFCETNSMVESVLSSKI